MLAAGGLAGAAPGPESLDDLLREVRACRVCAAHLPHGPRPLLQLGAQARLLVIGQAPGAVAHASGVPWSDRSGERLRHWLGIDSACFHDASRVAIVPMGLCYPGRGRHGDLPPRPECAPLWHERLLAVLTQLRLTLLIGQYAQRHPLRHALRDAGHASVTATTRDWRRFGPACLPLPHPSARNGAWFGANPWFEAELVPALRQRVREALAE
jgi:uracil-DNA glycosylase